MFPEIFRDDVFRLETPRLWLRWPTARDEGAIERLAGDPGVAAMTAEIPHPYPRGSAASFIYAARVGNAQGTALSFALAPVSRPHELIGVVGLRREEGVPTLGYWLGRPSWGRGLMSEAVEGLLGAVFTWTDIDEVAAHARLDNAPSRRVLEECGFVPVGEETRRFPARGEAFECALYRRTRSERAAWGHDAGLRLR